MAQMRLDKFLGEMGVGSRSQIKEMARKGRILVNGKTELKSDRKIDPQTDTVTADGRTVQYVSMEYYMLNKPAGTVSAREDGPDPTGKAKRPFPGRTPGCGYGRAPSDHQ